MKITLLKIVSALVLLSLTTLRAQNMSLCTGQSTVLTAINSQSLSNANYSLNPGGITSLSPSFAVTPSVNTVYTLYVTGTNTASQLVTSTNTVSIQVSGVSYAVTSPGSFTLGCGSKSVTSINIINASTYPIGGGAVSYTVLAPGISANLPAILSPLSSYSISAPGSWSVAARDNANGCTSWSVISIVANTLAPAPPNISTSQNILSCDTPSAVLQVAANPLFQYTWLPQAIVGSSIVITTNTAAPTQSLNGTYTLVIKNNNNFCQSDTSVMIMQNLFLPNAAITMGLPPSICQNTVMLTNISSSGIPPQFLTTQPVVGLLWQGPSPQNSLALSTTYLAQVSGIYTMTAKDLNNGCTKDATISVNLGPNAAFSYTANGGQVSFTDLSTGVPPNGNLLWDFGDGTTSTAQNPLHNYSVAGTYPVKLKIFTPSCTDSTIQMLVISGLPCIANANFSMAPTSTPQLWSITPAYPWNVTAAIWSWGDGSSTNQLYTSHQYSASGLYAICLSVTVSCSASASTCLNYSITRPSQAMQFYEVVVNPPTLISGMEQIAGASEKHLQIRPNPAKNEFTVDLSTLKYRDCVIELRDISGRLLLSSKPESDQNEIKIAASLPVGVYLLTATYDGQKISKRLMICE